MRHLYYYMGLACLLGCPLQLSAQETEKAEAPRTHEVNVKLDKTPDGFANHYSAFYYYSGKEILNMRNYLMKTADKVTSLYINPAGGSYAFIDTRKEKNTVLVYRLLEKDWQIGKVGTTKQYKPTAICYSPDARFLYVMGSDSRVHVFSTRKTQEVNSFAINGVGTGGWTHRGGHSKCRCRRPAGVPGGRSATGHPSLLGLCRAVHREPYRQMAGEGSV